MKTKFKDFLLYSLAIIGAVSLLLSAIERPKEDSRAAGYHAVASEAGIIVYNTTSGYVQWEYTRK